MIVECLLRMDIEPKRMSMKSEILRKGEMFRWKVAPCLRGKRILLGRTLGLYQNCRDEFFSTFANREL